MIRNQLREGCSRSTVLALLKSCTRRKDLGEGASIHAQLARNGILAKDLFIGSSLVTMYAKCGSLAKAQDVFDSLQTRDVVSWNALIAGYAQHDRGLEALGCFQQMQQEGASPDAVTFVCALKACGSVGAIDRGWEIHTEIMREEALERDIFVGSSLVDMYAKCGWLAKAQQLFDNLSAHDVVSWSALIAGYVQHGHSEKALNCYGRMQLEGISPNAVTFISVLKACGNIGALDTGQEIHGEIAKKRLFQTNITIGSSVVDMYAKCGLLVKAQGVLDKLPVRDVVSWSALITGYVQQGHSEEALDCYRRMQLEGISPNVVTFLCILRACGCTGAMDKGQEIHCDIARKGLLEQEAFVGSALVDMYVKCGSLISSQAVFNTLSVRDTVAWNVLISGYAQFGKAEDVLITFDKMLGDGINPTAVTFLSLLNLCDHTGLVEKGQMYFERMTSIYGIMPTPEHHVCMVDLLGRAGQLNKALGMIKRMPFHVDLAVWHIVLNACRKWGNVELGRHAFEHALQLDENDPSAFVCMSNIYSDSGLQKDVIKIEAMQLNSKLCKGN